MKTFLHSMAVGTYSRLFEALSSMLSRNTLNPADISIVSALFGHDTILPFIFAFFSHILFCLLFTYTVILYYLAI